MTDSTSNQPPTSSIKTFTDNLKAVFHGLDDNTVTQLSRIGETKTFEPETCIIRQGDMETTFYILLEGRVTVTHRSIGIEEVTLGVVTAGKYFGEMGLLEDVARTATCTAATAVKVLEISRSDFNEIMETRPKLAYSVMFQVLSNLRRNESNALNSLVSKAEELEQANQELKQAQARLVQAERFKRELEIAGEVQRSLLPRTLPEYDGIDFAAWLGSTRAGGDFYDVIDLEDDHIGILLGDVGSQGIQASLYMSMVRTLFRVECRRSLSPKSVALAVNRGILDVTTVSDMYANAFYGVLHKPSGLFSYIIAGQEQPFLYRPGQGVAKLKGRGNFLGLAPSITLEEKRLRVRPEDRLILVSDGIFGSPSRSGEVFTKDILIDLIKRSKENDAHTFIQTVSDTLEPWINHQNPYAHNDLAIMVMHVLPHSPT